MEWYDEIVGLPVTVYSGFYIPNAFDWFSAYGTGTIVCCLPWED